MHTLTMVGDCRECWTAVWCS